MATSTVRPPQLLRMTKENLPQATQLQPLPTPRVWARQAGFSAPGSAATRAWALARTVQLAKAEPHWQELAGRVREVLRGVWRASSLVECINSVARMHQGRHRKMTQGLLDLKRLYWNLHQFRAGHRKNQTPYGLLGLKLPALSFWEFLRMTPEELRKQLSATDDVL